MAARDWREPGGLRRRALGWCWALAWVEVLHLVTRPWHALGGLVDERLRWLHWLGLIVGLAAGYLAGGVMRDRAANPGGPTHRRQARLLWLPPAGATAAALAALWLVGGRRAEIGIVTTAFLAYWAGQDLGCGALPLMHGLDYRFDGAIEPDPDPERDDDDLVPPWERI